MEAIRNGVPLQIGGVTMDDKYIEVYNKGYNDALADLRFNYYVWGAHRLREKTDPVVLKRDKDLLAYATEKLKKETK